MEAGYHPLDKYHHHFHYHYQDDHYHYHKWNNNNDDIEEQIEDDGQDSARLRTSLSPG